MGAVVVQDMVTRVIHHPIPWISAATTTIFVMKIQPIMPAELDIGGRVIVQFILGIVGVTKM
jgi:hypothetical protein